MHHDPALGGVVMYVVQYSLLQYSAVLSWIVCVRTRK